MKYNMKKGFTLIELLVVIAIIGLLSSVVLASLNSARTKGADAAIKSNLANIRAQAEIYYDTNGNYGSNALAVNATTAAACGTANTAFVSMLPGITAAEEASNSSATWVAHCSMAINGASWSVDVPLKTGGSWCVDYLGASTAGTDSNGDGDCGA